MDDEYNYAPHVLEQFKNDPKSCQEHCKNLIDRRLTNFKRTHVYSEEQKAARKLFQNLMRQRLGDSPKGKSLYHMLIPEFPVGCRRQTPGPGYLEALLRDNVETRWDDIGRLTEKGIHTKNGQQLDFDVIICATGFDTTFKPRFPTVGRNGVNLAEKWTKEMPMCYFGMTAADMPNYFSMAHSPAFFLSLRNPC
jgi:cation diffusion facilitator CzcD-associated flavoprotein CzcO